MKLLIAIGAPLILGMALGVVTTLIEFSDNASTEVLPPVIVEGTKLPRATLDDSLDYQFGVMNVNETLSKVFTIRNEGEAPLTLEKGDTTCKCTLSDLANGRLEPGESTEINIEWTPKSHSPSFSQSAEIHTNDPRRPTIRITVSGAVRTRAALDPTSLSLGEVTINQGGSASLKVYGYESEEMEFISYDLADTPQRELLAVEHRPLTNEEVAQELGAKKGYAFTVTAKPGMPLGPIAQNLRMKFKMGKEIEFEAPISGQVVSDISWTSASSKFDRSKNRLNLGNVKSVIGAESTLFLVAKGVHRDNLELSVESIEPAEYLEVEIGDPSNNGGRTVLYPITVRLKPGGKPISRIGARLSQNGLVTIRTNHPEVKQVLLYVAFAVEN